MEIVRRQFVIFCVVILHTACAQLNFDSQAGAPIESRARSKSEVQNEENTARDVTQVEPAETKTNDVIAISPLQSGEVGRPEPIAAPLQQGESSGALQSTERAVNPASQQLLADARRSFVAGDLTNAEAITNRGLRVAPQDPLLWLQLAKIRLGQKSYAEAVSLSERAQVLAENDLSVQIDALQIIARAERARGNAARAAEVEQQVKSLRGELGVY